MIYDICDKNTKKLHINFNPKIKNRLTGREGHIVYISKIKSKCCPVKYL